MNSLRGNWISALPLFCFQALESLALPKDFDQLQVFSDSMTEWNKAQQSLCKEWDAVAEWVKQLTTIWRSGICLHLMVISI